jgi:hypothetical protein
METWLAVVAVLAIIVGIALKVFAGASKTPEPDFKFK